MKERRRYGGGVQGFLGNDMDAKLGVGGGVVSNGVIEGTATGSPRE